VRRVSHRWLIGKSWSAQGCPRKCITINISCLCVLLCWHWQTKSRQSFKDSTNTVNRTSFKHSTQHCFRFVLFLKHKHGITQYEHETPAPSDAMFVF
jgi:hypothetical protein